MAVIHYIFLIRGFSHDITEWVLFKFNFSALLWTWKRISNRRYTYVCHKGYFPTRNCNLRNDPPMKNSLVVISEIIFVVDPFHYVSFDSFGEHPNDFGSNLIRAWPLMISRVPIKYCHKEPSGRRWRIEIINKYNNCFSVAYTYTWSNGQRTNKSQKRQVSNKMDRYIRSLVTIAIFVRSTCIIPAFHVRQKWMTADKNLNPSLIGYYTQILRQKDLMACENCRISRKIFLGTSRSHASNSCHRNPVKA